MVVNSISICTCQQYYHKKRTPCSCIFWIWEKISHRCVSYPLDQCSLTSSRGQDIILHFFPFCFIWHWHERGLQCSPYCNSCFCCYLRNCSFSSVKLLPIASCLKTNFYNCRNFLTYLDDQIKENGFADTLQVTLIISHWVFSSVIFLFSVKNRWKYVSTIFIHHLYAKASSGSSANKKHHYLLNTMQFTAWHIAEDQAAGNNLLVPNAEKGMLLS